MKNDPAAAATRERLIAFWRYHRGFDANISALALFAGVSRDTVYRWLRREAQPRPLKAALVREWLDRRAAEKPPIGDR